jgi:NAD(P)-dependent dehydrogenase (short-subunit alcohol dehydrogenase family)
MDAVRATGRRAIAVQADVASETDVTKLFSIVDSQLGTLTVLVNNAGTVGAGRRRVEAMEAAAVNALLAINVTGLVLCSREAVLRMSTRRGGAGGSIVNVSSASSRLGAPGLWVDYAASKGAVDTFTVGLAREVAEEGIRINAVRPGLIDTALHTMAGMPDRVRDEGRAQPLGRAGSAEEVAEAILWLASPAAAYVSAALLDVAGAR